MEFPIKSVEQISTHTTTGLRNGLVDPHNQFLTTTRFQKQLLRLQAVKNSPLLTRKWPDLDQIGRKWLDFNKIGNYDQELEVEKKVNPDSLAASEVQFSVDEIQDSIKMLKNGSCPGSDGLPIEIYKVFWTKIKAVFMRMCTDVYELGELHKSGRKGILNLIPKGQKDQRYLKNLRPITLLNSDYKVLEKSIANRMVPELCEVINSDQTGFLPERKITSNIRKILDFTISSHLEDTPQVVMSCDYKKCFDMIEFEAIEKSMKMFGFSTLLTNWIRTLYHKFNIRIQNNGNFSKDIRIQQSVRQGGPASNAIFLTVAELVAQMLRQEKNISKGYMNQIQQFLNQFADDMDVCMNGEGEESIQAVLQIIEKFHQNTGFTLNKEYHEFLEGRNRFIS